MGKKWATYMVTIADEICLINNGETVHEREARDFALRSLKSAVEAVDPERLLHSKVVFDGKCLSAGVFSFEFAGFKHVFVIGGGKAGAVMSRTLEEILDANITSGIVNVPYGAKLKTNIIELNEASHPVPDQAGVKGARLMLALAKKAKKDDLVVCLISGGGSSLMPLPRKGVSLRDKQTLTEALLESGAPVSEVNVVRKHLSAFKGGWVAKAAFPATVLNLVLSDVVGDSLSSIASGPTAADPSTFGEAISVLEKHNLWASTSPSIRMTLSDGVKGLLKETPKPDDPIFNKVRSVVVGNNQTARMAAHDSFKSDGLNSFLVKKPIEGEAAKAGEKIAALARKIAHSGRPVSRPAGIVAGGETVVKVCGKGKGGRNQELALAAALKLSGLENCVVASLSTDGVDGPTDASGAIVDGRTMQRAKRAGLNAEAFLVDNDSYGFHERLGNLIKTGATGTNVNDITVIVLL